VQSLAAAIDDQALRARYLAEASRRMFLENVTSNREIVAAWEQHVAQRT